MKQVFISMLILGLAGAPGAPAQESSADRLVWCGLDYSMVKMIGTMDFAQPSEIFPGMLTAWNGLFMKEMLPQLEKMASPLGSDIKSVQAKNEKASAKQILREDGTRDEMVTPTHIKEKDIAKAVNGYDIKYDKGLGLVFIMDRLVKAQETGCLHVVFFDLASRKVVHSERLCEKAGGFGFRNYWFNPVKQAVKKLPRMYMDARSKSR